MGMRGHAVPRESEWHRGGPHGPSKLVLLPCTWGSWLPSKLSPICKPSQTVAFSALNFRWTFERLKVFVDLFYFWPSLICIVDCYSKNGTNEQMHQND